MLSYYQIKNILRGKDDSVSPADDFRIIDSYAIYDDSQKKKKASERKLEYLCYEIESINPETGEKIHFYKAIKFVRIIRLPKSAKQSTSFMDIQQQILSAVYQNGYNLITVIANIIQPVALGLLFLYGLQGVGNTIEEAKVQAHNDFIGFTSSLQGSFRVLEMQVINAQETEWLREKMYNMNYMSVVRGVPKASKTGEDMGNKGIGEKNLNPNSQGTLEEFITGMSDYEYVLQILSTPVFLSTLKEWSTRTEKYMTDWNSQLQGTKALSFNISMPMMYMANQSNSQGWSKAYTDADSVTTSTGESFSTGYGESVSESLSKSFSESMGISEGTSVSNSVSHSQSVSSGTSFGESLGVSSNIGESMGISQGQSYGENYGQSSSASHTIGSSENIGISNTESIGLTNTVSQSQSQSMSQGYSTSNSYSGSNSQSHSESVNSSESWGQSTSLNFNSAVSSSESSSSGSSVSLFGTGWNKGTSSSYSESSSIGGGMSQTYGGSVGSSVTNGNTSTQTYGSTSGQTNSASVGSSSSYGTSISNTVSQGTTQSWGASESYGVTDGVSQGQSYGLSSNMSNSQSISNGLSSSQNLGMSQSASEGVTVGSSIGKTLSQSYTQSSSTGTTEGYSQSQNISQGINNSTSVGSSQSLSTGNSGAYVSGMSSSMGFGPSVGYNKSYQWMDQQVKDILELLQYQNERIKKSLRGEGAFYTYVYIACSSQDALSAAQAVAKSTWQNEYAMVNPLQVLKLSNDEQKHLLYHFSAFSSDVTREKIGGALQYKYSTVLLPNEFVAYTHLPRISEGGVFADVDDIPKFAVPSMLSGEIYMGNVLTAEVYSMNHGRTKPFDFRIDEKELMHGFFTGSSRSGKTVAAMRFVAELANVKRKNTGKRLRIVCMDPKQDWRTLARFIDPERFRFFSLGNVAFRPVKINPLKIPHGVVPQTWIDGVIDIYCRAYGLLERGKQMMGETIYALYEEAGVFEACDHDDWQDVVPELSKEVTFTKVYKRMSQIKASLEDPSNPKGRAGNDTRDAYARLLDRLQCFSREFTVEHKLFGTSEGIGIDELIGNDDVTILESSGLEKTFKNFIFGVITSGFYKFAKAHEGGYLAKDQYETVLVLEEANEVLIGNDAAGSGGGSSMGMTVSGQSEFEEILDQSAGYGLFIIAITQKISAMPKSILANTGLVFAGRLKIPDDINAVIRSIGREERYDDRDLVKFFPRMPTGMFVCQRSRTFDIKDAEPVLVQISRLNAVPPSNLEIDEILTNIQTSHTIVA